MFVLLEPFNVVICLSQKIQFSKDRVKVCGHVHAADYWYPSAMYEQGHRQPLWFHSTVTTSGQKNQTKQSTYHITVIEQTTFKRGQEVSNPLVSL